MKHFLVRPIIFIVMLFVLDSCKKEQNTPTTKLVVGAEYQGGKIFYLLVPGDPGYDVNSPHGLIVATSDQPELFVAPGPKILGITKGTLPST